MVSAITERPYTFLRWLTGTLPGRKPLRRTLSLRSTRRASAFASRSDAGTLIWNSCFNPSARVSVTCMASIFFPLGPAKTPGHCQSGQRKASKPASVVRRTQSFRGDYPPETGPAVFVMQTLSALGAGGGARTHKTFAIGTLQHRVYQFRDAR